jgi:PAS domain S-box-containing protein
MMEKLLVLDDEPLILTSLEHLFEDDYEVFTTSDAEIALALAIEHDMAIILSDERMPGVTGHEFLRRVREVSKATRVMMSGYADTRALAEAVNSGQIFAYVAKPWEPLELKAKLVAATVHFKLVQEVDLEQGLLRALMENIPDLIFFKDCQSRFTRVNQAHAHNLGVQDPAECIGKSNADYFGVEDAQRWRLEEEDLVRTGVPLVDQIQRVNHPREGVTWWSTTKVPMLDRAGHVSGIAGIARNITGLKNTEEMLREQNEHNRMILETANDAFIGMDPDGSITSWNPQAEAAFGWSAADISGQRWFEAVIAPAYRKAHAQGVEHFLATARGSILNRPIELVALHRDGHEFPVEATIWPVQVRGACSYNAFVRDISERRQAEEARKREARLVQLLQAVTGAANRSSSIEHTARVCLRLICAHTGWQVGHLYLRANNSPEQLISQGLWHDEDSHFAAFREVSDRCLAATGTGLPGCVLASGKPEWIVDLAGEQPASERTSAAVAAGLRSGFGFPVLAQESVAGVLEFFSEQAVQPDDEFITVMGLIGSQLALVIIRQRAEAELKRAKASAELANLAKSEFLTTMSHEMRTPMNAILGMADLLSETSLQADQREYVEIFQRAGGNLLNLIEDILDLSKVESGYVELESIGFDLTALLEKVVEMMAARARERRLKLTLDVPAAIPRRLIGDPNRLRQILINLVGNALKFTEQGSVTIRVEPDPSGTAGWLRFSVVDTGIGIPSAKTELIFGRFTQADSSTTRKYGGSGLGLAISKGLVELMGGSIGCTSEVGRGSTFFFSAPFVRHDTDAPDAPELPDVAAIAAQQPLVAQHSAPRILIVEDSEDNIVLIQAYLKGCGFKLDFAPNGKIGVEKVMSNPPDLVLMDMQMPVMDGLEATRAIRQWEAETDSKPLPILALTAHAAKEGIARSLEAGCTEHLTKPIKKATLLAAIARYIGGTIRIAPPQDLKELVPAYLASVRRSMDEILAGDGSSDCQIARRLGHQFKGSGEGYGFPEITRTGAAVELAALSANEDEIRRQIRALAAYLDRVEITV